MTKGSNISQDGYGGRGELDTGRTTLRASIYSTFNIPQVGDALAAVYIRATDKGPGSRCFMDFVKHYLQT